EAAAQNDDADDAPLAVVGHLHLLGSALDQLDGMAVGIADHVRGEERRAGGAQAGGPPPAGGEGHRRTARPSVARHGGGGSAEAGAGRRPAGARYSRSWTPGPPAPRSPVMRTRAPGTPLRRSCSMPSLRLPPLTSMPSRSR